MYKFYQLYMFHENITISIPERNTRGNHLAVTT